MNSQKLEFIKKNQIRLKKVFFKIFYETIRLFSQKGC
jgi:hypothetical protein